MIDSTGPAQFPTKVVANISLCREHYRLVLLAEGFPATEPGQFLQILCRDQQSEVPPDREQDWALGRMHESADSFWRASQAYLRRPFSLAGRRETADGTELEFIYRVVGVGTDWLARSTRGDTVQILGPLGNRFELPAADQLAILIGGGVGIPPMLYLAQALSLKGRGAVAFCGATTLELLPLKRIADPSFPGPDSCEPELIVEEFSRHGIHTVISTDDGSFGFRGFVTQALEKYLENAISKTKGPHAEPLTRTASDERQGRKKIGPMLYVCGPEAMMKRVSDIAGQRGLECQVAVERAMACGMGTCQSCVIRVATPSGSSPWAYRLTCKDGPVFRAAELAW